MDHAMATESWQFMQDGVLFATFNRQGGPRQLPFSLIPRGETDFHSQNWYMLMATHDLARGVLTLTGMISLEPATVGARGYGELFQMGEAYHGLENIDRQHPHDLFMQLGAIWRTPLGNGFSLTLAGAPVGEAALGPVAYMHRASASENPIAPVSHHTFDSTHVTQGVVTAGIDRGAWTIESSAFHGREPDEDRWNLETHSLDSYSVRVGYRPSPAWAAQFSHGFLKQPEQLEPGDQRRTNGSLSWFRERENGFIAVSTMYGRVQRTFTNTWATLSEATAQLGETSVYGRVEELQVETEHLLFPTVVHRPHPGELLDRLGVFTVGAVRNLWHPAGFDVGMGGDVVFYAVPALLQLQRGVHPVSFHLFMRVRPPVSKMGRMWNRTMTDPMAGEHDMAGMHHATAGQLPFRQR